MSKLQYADIAFPTAVRQVFTYETRDASVRPGMRVWVPLRNVFAIGMVIKVHEEKPEFETRPMERVLDEEPVMEEGMLGLAAWMHRFYYCSMGEAIQAALPVGMNFTSEKRLEVRKGYKGELTQEEIELLQEIEEQQMTLKEAEKRWRDGSGRKFFNKAKRNGWITIWEQPRQKSTTKRSSTGSLPQRELAAGRFWMNWMIRPAVINGFRRLKNCQADGSCRFLTGNCLRNELFTTYTFNRIEKEGWIESVDLPVESDRSTTEFMSRMRSKPYLNSSSRPSRRSAKSWMKNHSRAFCFLG
jgi:primosomal protein N' (replication factor Y) (superfamily II helicase)